MENPRRACTLKRYPTTYSVTTATQNRWSSVDSIRASNKLSQRKVYKPTETRLSRFNPTNHILDCSSREARSEAGPTGGSSRPGSGHRRSLTSEVSRCTMSVLMKPISLRVFSNITRGSELKHLRQLGAMIMDRLLTSIFVMETFSGRQNS